MTGLIHVIIRVSDDTAYATSPQAPGMVFVRDTVDEIHAELQEVLAFYFDAPGPYPVAEHRERHFDIHGHGEIVTRVALDAQQARRTDVYLRIGAALTVPEQVPGLLGIPTNLVGECVYVCAVASDTLGWLYAQLDERGDAFAAAVAVADPFLFALPLMSGDPPGSSKRPSYTLGQRDYGPDTTIGEVMKDTAAVSPVGMRIPA
ncbi:hypothetical protein OG216_09555 [Streptomycetaceae bacterium NBC_01309]